MLWIRDYEHGKKSASDLDLQLMDDSGKVVSQPARIGVLGGSEEVLVRVVDEARDRNPLHLKLTWLDRNGENERTSRVQVPGDWNRPERCDTPLLDRRLAVRRGLPVRP